MAQFGDLLAELRQDRGLTQSELGKVISVTSGTISNYEHGFHLPDLEKLVLLAERFLFISILLDAVMKLLQHASITFCKYETDPILIFEATHL